MYFVTHTERFRQFVPNVSVDSVAQLSAIPDTAVNDLVLIDSDTVSTTDLYEHVTTHRDSKMVYVVDRITNPVQAMSTALKIPVITWDGLVSYLEKTERHIESRPVVTFFGVLPQLGTTTLCLAVASKLVETYRLRVGVLGLNLYEPGAWMISQPLHHLDELQSHLKERSLTPASLTENMYELKSGVRYLFGHRNQASALEKYTISDIAYLIEQAEQAFDLVILDAGSVFNTPAALQALITATLRFGVITDRMYVDRKFHQFSQSILRPLDIRTEDIFLIGNKMQQANERTLLAYARNLKAQPTRTSLPDETLLLYQAEQHEDAISRFLEARTVGAGISLLAAMIAATYGYAQ
ncbi:hypothetical protein [Alicyclobacillus ferrooxydans]|uniref:AAA domain-containing protein n=1 Tax=Alicyclobacillus ferrooxydans TaxID=471514 RepID=A0A0P9EUP0_9BACL|nr:hypothetical protein [Alicyclobacillus ferrooxydans]KPV42687.1 hypothetical protein AN477_16270 [Alicyclobacillus ferrooxydans]